MTKKYNKLVRDRIPEIIESSGNTCVTEILSDEDYLRMLDAKLDEELAEYHADQNIEELADLMEVMTVIEYGQQNKNVALLLHGGGLSWWNYRDAAEILSEDFHVVLPVLDGHGGERFTSIQDNAARIISYIDEHFGGQVAVLGGLSLGGQVALEMLAQRPDICRSALIESALVKPSRLTRALIGPTFAMSYGLIKQRWFARWQASYLGIPRALFEDYYRDTCAISKENLIAFMRANCGYALKPMATTASVKIVAGSREQRSILESAKMIHRAIPGSELEILPGLRHGDLSLNHPAWYARMVKEWSECEKCGQLK